MKTAEQILNDMPFQSDGEEYWYGYDIVIKAMKAYHADREAGKKQLTDHELLKLAVIWHDELETTKIGLRTSFAAGYRAAERRLIPAPFQEGGNDDN